MMNLYAVIDRKAKSIVTVFTSNSDESAERSFLMLLTGAKNVFTDFPEDFDLYPVGTLSFTSFLKVARSGLENLEAAGFTADTYAVNEPLKCGSDYDKRYLRMVRDDRFNLSANVDSEEVSEDGM